jgi:hypothetical protein
MSANKPNVKIEIVIKRCKNDSEWKSYTTPISYIYGIVSGSDVEEERFVGRLRLWRVFH